MMKHLMKYLTMPLAFAAVFLLFGTPSAPGVAAVEAVAGVSAGVGGCAMAYGPGEDPRDMPAMCGNTPCPPPPDPCHTRAFNLGVLEVIGYGLGAAALGTALVLPLSVPLAAAGLLFGMMSFVGGLLDDC